MRTSTSTSIVGDLGALATNYGLTANAVWAQGDFNNDGKVDVGDLGILATNYGQTLGGGASAAAATTHVMAASPAARSSSDPFAGDPLKIGDVEDDLAD